MDTQTYKPLDNLLTQTVRESSSQVAHHDGVSYTIIVIISPVFGPFSQDHVLCVDVMLARHRSSWKAIVRSSNYWLLSSKLISDS